MTNQWYSPANIYGQLYKEDLATMGPISPERNAINESKEANKICISENGETVLLPDIAKVSISYKSVKVSDFRSINDYLFLDRSLYIYTLNIFQSF